MKSIETFTQSTEAMNLADINKVKGGQLFLTSKLVVDNLETGTRTITTVRDKKDQSVVIRTRTKDI